jgi:hypothetical protein
MAEANLYEILGVSKERADEIAKAVREAFSKSSGPADFVRRLIEDFGITPENAEVFACGWFAGRYAGVSEVFNIVQREMDKLEKDKAEREIRENRYPPGEGYA